MAPCPAPGLAPGLALAVLALAVACATTRADRPADKDAASGPAGAQPPGAAPGAERPRAELPYPPNAPQPGQIHHLPTGLPMSFEQALDVVAGARLVFIGETHDNVHAHEVELAVLRELHKRHGGRVALGMEMFRVPQQPVLDRWVRGELSEPEFLRQTNWFHEWGADFGYYRGLLEFAKAHGVDVVALNPPRELQQQVSHRNIDALPPELAAQLPEIGDPDQYARQVAQAYYGGHIKTPGQFDAFFRVQTLWEESMAQQIARYLDSERGRGKVMVAVTGGAHVRYGFGLPKKVLRRKPLPYVIVLPEEVSIPPEKQKQMMDVDMPELPLIAGDFLFWVAYEDLEGKRVRLGVGINDAEGKALVAEVTPGSPAEKAGIRPGDVLLSIDGTPVKKTGDVVLLLQSRKPGEEAKVVVKRGDAERAFTVVLQPVAVP